MPYSWHIGRMLISPAQAFEPVNGYATRSVTHRPDRVGHVSVVYDLRELSQGRYLPQNPPVTPKTHTPRRPTWRTAKSTLVPFMINIL